MESICGGDKPFMSSAALDGEHLRVKDKAIEHFQGRRKMGGAEFSEKYKERLEQVNIIAIFLKCSNLWLIFDSRKSKNSLAIIGHKTKAKIFSKHSKLQQLYL